MCEIGAVPRNDDEVLGRWWAAEIWGRDPPPIREQRSLIRAERAVDLRAQTWPSTRSRQCVEVLHASSPSVIVHSLRMIQTIITTTIMVPSSPNPSIVFSFEMTSVNRFQGTRRTQCLIRPSCDADVCPEWFQPNHQVRHHTCLVCVRLESVPAFSPGTDIQAKKEKT